MNLLDARTVVFSYAISNFVCMIVMAILWKQNRRRFPGLGFWLADFIMQFFALVLIILRGIVPDFLSMTVSNTMIIGGTILLLIGLEHFTGKRGPQIHNYILLAAFIVAHAYFVFVLPNLAVRNIIISLGLLAICSHAAWLMLHRVKAGMRPITRGVGQVFLGFCLISIARIAVELVVPSGNDFFHSNTFETLLLITYQMLFIVLTLSLFLMVNRRLFADLEDDVTERKQAEAALEKHNRALQILHKVSLDIGFELETITLLNRILNYAVDLFDADRGGGIYLYDSDEHALRLVKGSVVNEGRAGTVLQLNEGVAGRVFQTSQPLIVNDYTNWEGRATVIVPWPPSAVMGVPLLLEGQVIGVLNVVANSHRRIFIQADVQLAQMLAAQAVTAIRNVQLYEQAQGEITERKQAEQKLNEAKEKAEEKTLQLLQLENNLKNSMVYQLAWTVMGNGEVDKRIRHISNMVAKFYGCTPEQAIADSSLIYNKIHKDDIQRLIDEEATALKNMTTFDTVVRVFNPNGEIRWSHYTSTPRKHNEKIYWDGIEVDITERKQAEEVLEQRTHELGERVKELNCLFGLSNLAEISGDAPEVLMQGVVELLPPALQYPSITCARITSGGQIFSTTNFEQTPWQQQRPIRVHGAQVGSVEICYLEARPDSDDGPFLWQEGRLLGAIAERLGKAMERIQTRQSLQESESLLRAIAENYPNSYISIIEKDLTIGFTSGQEFKKQNLDPDQFVGLTLEQVFGDNTDIVREHYLKTFEGNETTFELLINGHHQLYRAVPLFAPDGSIPRILSVVENITERRRAEEIFQMRIRLLEFAAAHSLEELMQRALDEIGQITNSPIGFYHFVEADQKTLSLQAWSTRTEKEFCKAEGKGMHYSIDQAGVWADCVRQRKPVIHNDYAALPHRKGLPDGHAEAIRELVVPILRQGRVVSILGVGNKPTDYDDKDVDLVAYIADVVWEIIQRKRAEEKLLQLSRAVEQSPASIVITDTTGSIEYVNPKFTEITGYTSEEAIGKNPRILKTDQTPEEVHRQLWETITSGREWRGEFVNQKKNGELYYESASISPIIDNSGVTTHYVAVKEDITATKLNEQKLQQANQQLHLQLDQIQSLQTELREQAIRDPLTGLYNRRYLDETLKRELARAVRENYPISFVMIDIDYFKKINDAFGHDTGDVVLRKLAAQLLSQTRVVDIACRYGGEEFLIILPNVTVAKTLEIAERWRKSFMGFTMPLGHSSIQTTISCGISVFPLDGNTGEELISNADKAMYQAKATGRNRVVVWQNEMTG
jgi:diguanylate cyclase (GGDEF)-like protein/PAS domain S-box-containing protein